MPLDISKIVTGTGKMNCILWENKNIDLPLQLFYSIEIPLEPFDTGHDYVEQPTVTSFIIEWIRFADNVQLQEKSWRNLLGKEFSLSYENDSAEGSIYLGTEHCQFNSFIKFTSLNEMMFDVDLQLAIDLNIDTINLSLDGFVKIKAKVGYEGLILYSADLLPDLNDGANQLLKISRFLDLSVYQDKLIDYENPYVKWKQLKPR